MSRSGAESQSHADLPGALHHRHQMMFMITIAAVPRDTDAMSSDG